MPNWDSVYDYLQPKEPLYCPEEPSITQKVFLRSNATEALFGGAAGGGKSSALLMSALQYVDVPGYTAILFRRTYADLALPGALMDRFMDWIKDYEEVRWNANTYTATFPSGARITFGYLNNVQDRLRYKSAEFQFVGMDEVTEIREDDYKYMFSRIRRPLSGPASKVPLRMRSASNPAPNWVRQRFIVEGKSKGRVFVKSLLADNPGIDHTGYRKMLQQLSETERLQLEEGEWWTTGDGDVFSREDFTIIEPNEMPTFLSPKAVRFWDMASTKYDPEKAPDPDWTAGVLMVYENGIAYIIDVVRCREESPEVEALVAKTAAEDGIGVEIRAEQEPGGAGKSLVNMYSRNVVPGYDFDAVTATGNKATRAKPLASANRNGNLKLVRGEWNTDFIDELCAFKKDGKGVAHDDQVDAAAHAFAQVTGITGKERSRIQILV